MGAIDMALREIRHTIPPEILKRVFSAVYDTRHRTFYLSDNAIREAIRALVIEDRLRPLCDTTNPTMVNIPIGEIQREVVPPKNCILRIPKAMTSGRRLTSVESHVYGSQVNGLGTLGYGSTAISSLYGQSATLDMGMRAMNSMSPIIQVENPYCTIIDENVVAIEGWHPQLQFGFIRGYVSYDEQFSNIGEPYWPSFAQMCIKATKAFIYNFYRIEMDMGVLEGGRELGTFKETIEEYRDAEELFQEYFNTTWRKQVKLADAGRMQRDIRMRMGSFGG